MEYELLKSLNSEQRLPAKETEGAVLVSAGAGSGKTRLLTHRIAHLVKDKGVNPRNILAITFTNKAAKEMKERLSNMVDVSDMQISTFHSLCCKTLRRHAPIIGFSSDFSIYGDDEKSRLVKRIIETNELELSSNSVCWHISECKNKLMTAEEYYKKISGTRDALDICKVIEVYCHECKQNNAMDFDDLLNRTIELFESDREVLSFYQNLYQYIHVDEFQDTNLAQYKLIKMLSDKYKNVFVVGDEDQCIYTWRGAEVTNMKDFEHDFKGAKVFKLEQNYRSTKNILKPANKLIAVNCNRHDKELWTENEDGSDVTEFVAYSDLEEAEYVASTIKRLISLGEYKARDFAILMRVNALSRIYEEKLLGYGIAHEVYGGFKFFERKEIKDTLAYLKVLLNKKDNDAFIRVLGFPKKGIGEKSVQDLYLMAKEQEKSMYECVESMQFKDGFSKKFFGIKQLLASLGEDLKCMQMGEFVDHLVKAVGIKEAIGNKSEEEITRQMNIDDLVLSVRQFADANPGSSLNEYLESVTLMRDIDNLDDASNTATITTVHSAKGLEFPVVFVVGLTDGMFPLSRAINSPNPDDLEEERRLMYVAMTRAKKRLYLTRSRTKFVYETKRTEVVRESRFLREMRGDTREEQSFDSVFTDKYSPRSYSTQSTGERYFSENKPKIEEKRLSSDLLHKFQKGDRVKHSHFGEGVVTIPVTDASTGFITVKFDSVGIKTLSLKFAPLEKV